MPTIILTDPFKEDFFKLLVKEQKQARKALRFLAENPKHPSLRVHKIRGTPFWEAYVNKDVRTVYQAEKDVLTLHAIGHHDILKEY
ncbi:type II toxin-antitoxin system YafQ family toxin [Syntrophothermus lipocalidus]|uniref:DNA helicase n=1 Tax=Syntrophothermus lipocalidus (strain DSM 12680 / TGB-C1) TaxID=643648 RepID=D7CNS7_SYNLT|nr:DNA helicase [Syntrophothermus lipocalidus]ADI02362.1 conserved hypothetical protein [Syntrophothermus lipocalidus DSM 12680]